MSTKIWWYARGGEKFGPYETAEIKSFASSGSLLPGDLLWKEGMQQWVGANSVKGLFPAAEPPAIPPVTVPPSIPRQAAEPSQIRVAAPVETVPPTAASAPPSRPALWNPNAAASWSLLLTAAFGAWLHAKNWNALGQPGKAEKSMWWVYAGFALFFVAPFLPDQVAAGLPIWYLLGWYFFAARPQAKLVKESVGNDYERKSWIKPIAIGMGAMVCYIIFFAILGEVFG